MRIAEMDWPMVEDWVRHDDRAVLPLGSTEQHAGLSLADRCHPRRARRGGGGRTARRAGVSRPAVRPLALFPGLSRQHHAARRDLCACRARRARQPQARAASAASSSSTAMAATSRRRRWRRNGWSTTPTAACASMTGGARRAPGRRCRRPTRWRATASWHGELPLDAPRQHADRGRQGDGRHRPAEDAAAVRGAHDAGGRQLRRPHRSAATPRCWRSGTSPSRRRATLMEAW